MWKLHFDDAGLYASSKQLPVSDRHTAPAMSLKTLLSKKTLERVDLFPNTRKAALALSLGQGLLHLSHSGWVQEKWTAEMISFLSTKIDNKEHIHDVHRPYITCKLPGRKVGTTVPILEKTECYRMLCSLAILLLEIRTGKPAEINIYENEDRFQKSISEAVWGLQTRGYAEVDKSYHQAIFGCTRVPRSLEKHQREAAEYFADNSTYNVEDVRRILYREVIQYLEEHHACISGTLEGVVYSDTSPIVIPIQESLEGTANETTCDVNGSSQLSPSCSSSAQSTEDRGSRTSSCQSSERSTMSSPRKCCFYSQTSTDPEKFVNQPNLLRKGD